MITKVEIVNNENTPLSYLSSINGFENGKSYEFKPGINIVIGKNGCGKSTLLKLISIYCLCGGKYFSEIGHDTLNPLFDFTLDLSSDNTANLKDGANIHCDYAGVVYNYIAQREMKNDTALKNIGNFECFFRGINSSTGESMMESLMHYFSLTFENKDVQFPIQKLVDRSKRCNNVLKDNIISLLKYYKKNAIDISQQDFEYTMLMDEPDRNLDVFNIQQIYGILSQPKEMTQLICVLHNPIVIYRLSKLPNINFVEMSDGYLDSIKEMIKKL